MSSMTSKITSPREPTDAEVVYAIRELRSELNNIYSADQHPATISVSKDGYTLELGAQTTGACKFCFASYENRYELLKHLDTHRAHNDADDDLAVCATPCYLCTDKYRYARDMWRDAVSEQDDAQRDLEIHGLIIQFPRILRVHMLEKHARAAISLLPEYERPDAMETSP